MTNPLEPTQSVHNSDGDVFENAAGQARAHGLDQLAALFDHLGGRSQESAGTESGAHTSAE